MLLKADAAQLEWRVKVFLAQDKVGVDEINDPSRDIHSENQEFFKLPSRLIAKTFIYRMIFADAFGEQGFRGPAYAYANDAEFRQTSVSPKYWEKVIERFFEKYQGIHDHSIQSIRHAVERGYLDVPSGARYPFAPRMVRGAMDWPRSEILNYPVQGFSAQLMQVARLEIMEKWPTLEQFGEALLINTVHDDVETDVDNKAELIYNTSILLEDCFAAMPLGFEKRYGSKINVPMAGEVKYGLSLDETSMHKFKRDSFYKDLENHYGIVLH